MEGKPGSVGVRRVDGRDGGESGRGGRLNVELDVPVAGSRVRVHVAHGLCTARAVMCCRAVCLDW